MRGFLSKLIVLAAAVLGTAVWLIPGRDEVAMMNYKSGGYRAAIDHYQDEYRRGNLSPGVIVPLARLHLQFGELPAAARLVSDLTGARPQDPDAWKLAARLYELAGMPLSRISALQQQAALEPGAMRELGFLYRLYDLVDAEQAVLEQLVERKAARAAEYQRLAELYALAGKTEAAADHIARSAAEFPESFGYREFKAYLSYAGAPAARTAERETLTRLYLDSHPDAEAQNGAASLLLAAGDAAGALLVLGDLHGLHESQQLLYASAMIQLGRSAEVLERLWPIWSRAALPSPLSAVLADLLLSEQKTARLDQFLKRVNLSDLEADVVVRIVRNKLPETGAAGRKEWAARLAREMPAYSPALRLFADYLAGRLKPASALLAAAAKESLPPAERELLLAGVQAAGDRQASLALAATLADHAALSDQGVLDVATVLIDSKQSAGWRLLEEARRSRSSAPLDRLWLLEMLRAGTVQPALAWLREHPAQPRHTLLDAFTVAAARGLAEPALVIATLLDARFSGRQSRLCLARALRLNGRLPDALKLYRTLDATPEVEHELLSTLAALSRGEPRYREELRAALELEIGRSSNAARRRAAAFIALEDLHDKKLAETLFMELAASADPASPDMKQLLYLWGPRPPAAALRWLEERFEKAVPAQRPAWLRILYRLGDEQYANTAAEKDLEKLSADVQLSYLESLAGAGQEARVAAAFMRVLRGKPGQRQVSELVKFARRHSYRGLVDAALAAGAASGSGSAGAEGELAVAAFEAANYREAVRHFELYFSGAAEPGDAAVPLYLMHYHYAEALAQLGRQSEAHKQLAAVLSLLDSDADRPARAVRAAVLARLDRKEEAAGIMKQLLREEPDNLQLRSDLANLLVELRRYREAQEILADAR